MWEGMLTLLLSLFFITPPADYTFSASDSTYEVSDSIQNTRVRIDKIFIVGNKKTKKKIILRELDIAAGEIYQEDDLKAILTQEKNKITNLRLFTSVEVSMLYLSPTLVDIVIEVKERWYTFPVPIFSIVDRNLNDWWTNQNHDFSRTNYGIKLYQNNFRGRNETLNLLFQLGYTRQFGFTYRIPYIDASQRHGLSLGFDYSENKNIAVQTAEHKQIFLDSEDLLRTRRNFFVGYRFRNSFYTRHSAYISFNSNAVNDTIVALNDNYYQPGETTQRYFELSYAFQRDKRDIVSYPLRGNELEVQLTKSGLGFFNDVNQFDIRAMYTQYKDLNKGFYFANYSSVYLSGPSKQPYTKLGALGYRNDFVRGYELFLIEGQNYFLNRTTLKKRILNIKGRLGFFPIEQFRDFPLAIYIKTYLDLGYVENIDRYEETQQNVTLANRYLGGTGFGIDFVTYYDTVLRFEYSFTREGTSGFFFHLKKEF